MLPVHLDHLKLRCETPPFQLLSSIEFMFFIKDTTEVRGGIRSDLWCNSQQSQLCGLIWVSWCFPHPINGHGWSPYVNIFALESPFLSLLTTFIIIYYPFWRMNTYLLLERMHLRLVASWLVVNPFRCFLQFEIAFAAVVCRHCGRAGSTVQPKNGSRTIFIPPAFCLLNFTCIAYSSSKSL